VGLGRLDIQEPVAAVGRAVVPVGVVCLASEENLGGHGRSPFLLERHRVLISGMRSFAWPWRSPPLFDEAGVTVFVLTRLAQWPERVSKFYAEQLRLFAGREMASSVNLVEVDQTVIRALGPTAGSLRGVSSGKMVTAAGIQTLTALRLISFIQCLPGHPRY
jgi:hypothetical protein